MSKIFLSHNHADKPFVRKLAADLRAAGHAVWIDEAEIRIGDSLVQKIRAGLDEVDYVAAVLSTASIQSAWVERELDIASNREIAEGRVVVLPLLRERVELPGFLKGKLYGDFTDDQRYDESLETLLRSLGPIEAPPSPEPDELAALREQLAAYKAIAAGHQQALDAHRLVALSGKSQHAQEIIAEKNARFPSHAPINTTYAFEIGSVVVTLDYLFWCIQKAERMGGHPLDILLTVENRWGDVERMLQAYEDLLATYD